jgi:predicted permease
MPGIAYVFFMLAGTTVDSFVKTIIILELAMPCAAIVTVLAARYGSDYKFATENVVYSTMFSMFTLPLVLYVLNTLT